MRRPEAIDDRRPRGIAARRAAVAALALAWGLAAAAWSNQPVWGSDEEHAADRDAVFRGVVRGQELIGRSGSGTGEELWRAEVEVLEVYKPHLLLDSLRTVVVLFEQPADRSRPGWPGLRCPPYVALETGRPYTFFARAREVEGGHPFLELPSGSDVRLRGFGEPAGAKTAP